MFEGEGFGLICILNFGLLSCCFINFKFIERFIYMLCLEVIKMADAGIFVTDAQILKRCGANVSATVAAAGWFDTIILDIESGINCMTRFNYSDAFTAGLNADVRGILTDTAACLAAIQGILFDMSGFTSRIEAEDMVNILRDIALRNLSILRDKKVQDFITGA